MRGHRARGGKGLASGLGARRWLAALVAVLLAISFGVVVCAGLGTAAHVGGGATPAANDDGDAALEPGLGSVPAWATWSTTLLACDLDGDGLAESLWLKDRQLAIYGRDVEEEGEADREDGASSGEGGFETSSLSVEGGLSVCRTNADWLVSASLVGDIDHEGTPELVLLVWAPGSYGPSRPFWVEEEASEASGYCEHVYILRYAGGRLVPLWMSSALEVEAADATLDAAGRLHLLSPDGSQTCWAWQSWGLTLVASLPADPTSDADAKGEDDGPQVSGSGGGVCPVGEDESFVATGCLTLLAVGDNIVHRGVLEGARLEDGSYDFAPVYREVAPWVSAFDLAAMGQEAPLLASAREASPVCGAPYALGDALVGAGFDVVANASNHVGDFGAQAISDELAFWEEAHPEVQALGIYKDAGEQRYSLVSRKGVRIALFDYTQSTGRGSRLSPDESWLVDQLADEARLQEDLRAVEEQVDLSVCFLHTGPEGHQLPDDFQRELCQRLVDAGADVVICSHAHAVMPFARVTTDAGNVGIVYYGLGNFVSCSFGRLSVLEAAATLEVRVEGSGAERHIEVQAGMVPLVCHADDEGIRVYRLADYSDVLADSNRLLANDGVSASDLAREWVEACTANPG